jgi:hypothetical protein
MDFMPYGYWGSWAAILCIAANSITAVACFSYFRSYREILKLKRLVSQKQAGATHTAAPPALSEEDAASFSVKAMELEGIHKTSTPMIITNVSEDPLKVQLVLVNEAYCQLVEYEAHELHGSLARILAGPDTDLSAWVDNGRRMLAKEPLERGIGYLYTKTRQRKLVSWNPTPIDHDENGIPRHCFSVLREVRE